MYSGITSGRVPNGELLYTSLCIYYIYIFFIISQNVWQIFWKKKFPRVFTYHWASHKQPEFMSCMHKVKKFKCSKIPQGGKGFSIWPMDYKDSSMRSILSKRTCLRQPYQRMSLARLQQLASATI